MNDPARLAVVIPTINEAGNLGALLDDLAAQRGIRLEVAVADGGSRDDTVRAAEAFAQRAPFPVTVVAAPRGRGRQMNAGAAATEAPDLLFLHADSRIEDSSLLRRALERMEVERAPAARRVAGHFGVRFHGTAAGRSFGYYFSEAKTHLDRPGCRNGDQGFWLSRLYFRELGGYDESLPFLEDSRLAARISETGRWVTLPGTLATAARRFEAEGLKERQILNVFIRSFEALGDVGFFTSAAEIYRDQSSTDRLELLPFFRLAGRRMARAGALPALARWYRLGAYVRSQAWQIPFALDCFRAYRKGVPSGDAGTPCLGGFDRWLNPLFDHPPGSALAALLAAAWFYGTFCRLSRRRSAAAENMH